LHTDQREADRLGDSAAEVVVAGVEVVVCVSVSVSVCVCVCVCVAVDVTTEVFVVVFAGGGGITSVTVGAVFLSVTVTGSANEVTAGTSVTPAGAELGRPIRSATITLAISSPVAMPPRTPTAMEPGLAMSNLLDALRRN
jgi:hypothetical protein